MEVNFFVLLAITAAFLVFSCLFVQSVLREIRQKEKMEKMARELQAVHWKIKQLDKEKSEFVSIASHQLRTPLSVIIGYLSMILEGTYGKITDKVKKPVSNVFKASRQLNQLLNTLLSLSRIEAGKLMLEAKKMSLKNLLQPIVEEFKIVAQEKGLKLKLIIPTSLPPIPLDEEKMNQVIMNILDNAIKYTEKGGIEIRVNDEKQKVLIEIQDTGAGMDKKQAGQIFQKFQRGMAGKTAFAGGAGLGLFVAKKFVELHKGKIWAKSEGQGKGSIFFVELPKN